MISLTYLRCELNYSPHSRRLPPRSDLGWRDDTTSGGRYAFDPASVTLLDLREWIFSLSKRGSSPRTVRRKVQALRPSMVDDAQPRSAGQSGRRADTAQARKAPASIRQTGRNGISAQRRGGYDRFRAGARPTIVDMLYTTGMRCSELTGSYRCRSGSTVVN